MVTYMQKLLLQSLDLNTRSVREPGLEKQSLILNIANFFILNVVYNDFLLLILN